jgi:hypothetical protein
MERNAKFNVRKLVVISLGLSDPEGIVSASYVKAGDYL